MSLATGIAFCRRYLGFPYGIWFSRFGLNRPIHFDCSGYAWRYCDEAGTPLPPSVSTTFAMVAYAEDHPALGLIVTREFALTHAGVLCLRGGRIPSGKNGSGGHVAVSDGAGGTYEAQSTRTGVIRGLVGQRFDFFMVPPGYRQPTPDDPTESEDDMARANSLLIQGVGVDGKPTGPVYVWNVETYTKAVVFSETQYNRLVEIRGQLAFPNNVINPYPFDFVEQIPEVR